MPCYIFTEDEKGRLGYSGKEYFSRVHAEDEAEDLPGITHIIEADNLAEAKQRLRGKLVKKKEDMNLLYKNVRRT